MLPLVVHQNYRINEIGLGLGFAFGTLFKGQGPGLVNVLFVKRKFDYSHGTPHPDGDAHTHCGRRDTTHYATGRR